MVFLWLLWWGSWMFSGSFNLSGLFGMSIWSLEYLCQCRGFFGARIGVDSPFFMVSKTSGCFLLRRLYLKILLENSRKFEKIFTLACLLGVCSFWSELVGWQNAYRVLEHRLLMARKLLCPISSRKMTCIHFSSNINVDNSISDNAEISYNKVLLVINTINVGGTP